MRAIAWLIFVLSVLAVLFCGYAYMFWAWVTATPLSGAELARARYNAHAWLALTGLSFIAAVVAVAFAIRLGRRRGPSGFDVLPPGSDGPPG